MRGFSVVMVTVATLMASATPAQAGHDMSGCHAELSPRTVVDGATQAFSIEVTNWRELPTGVPLQQINHVTVIQPKSVTLASVSATPPWSGRVTAFGDATFDGGALSLGDSEQFEVSGSVAGSPPFPNTRRWRVMASRDGGQTGFQCEPEYPGALDLLITAS